MTDKRLKEITNKAKRSWEVLEEQAEIGNFTTIIDEALINVYIEHQDLMAYELDLSNKIGELEAIKNKQLARIEFIKKDSQRRIDYLEAQLKNLTK